MLEGATAQKYVTYRNDCAFLFVSTPGDMKHIYKDLQAYMLS